MRRVNLPALAKLFFGRVLWPVGALLAAGACVTAASFVIPQAWVDAGFGQLLARGVIAAYDREHLGVAAMLADSAAYRRYLLLSLALYGLAGLTLLHQGVLALVRRSRPDFVDGDPRRFRWLLLILAAFSLSLVLSINDPLEGRFGRVVGPWPTGWIHLGLMFCGSATFVAFWRAILLVTGRLGDLAPRERWPTRPWMTRFPIADTTPH